MDNFEDVFEKLTDYDLLAIIKAGPDKFYELVEGEAFRRMRRTKLEEDQTEEISSTKVPEKQPMAEVPEQPPPGDTASPVKKKRVMSAAARKRISTAQKKRWLKWNKDKR